VPPKLRYLSLHTNDDLILDLSDVRLLKSIHHKCNNKTIDLLSSVIGNSGTENKICMDSLWLSFKSPEMGKIVLVALLDPSFHIWKEMEINEVIVSVNDRATRKNELWACVRDQHNSENNKIHETWSQISTWKVIDARVYHYREVKITGYKQQTTFAQKSKQHWRQK